MSELQATSAEVVARLAAITGAGRRSGHVSNDDHGLLRFVGTVQFLAGALLLVGISLLPDPDISDHEAFFGLAVLGMVAAAARWTARNESIQLARFSNLGCIVFIGIIVAVARPIGPTPVLMLWPLLSTAYFLGRRDLAGAGVLMTVVLTLALMLNPGVGLDLPLQLVPTLLVVAVASVLMVMLRERVDGLIGDLERTASTDGLTGLPNRTSFNASFAAELERARRTGAPLALALFDLDRFKAINDCLGHAEGDKALMRFSSLLATECRSFDVPGRLGGEEFGLLLVGSGAEGAQVFCERLRGRLALVTAHDLTSFTTSSGVAQLGRHGHDMQSLMLAADRALYRAKEEGRDRVLIAAEPGALESDLEVIEGGAEDDALEVLAQSAEQLSLSVTLKLEPQPQAATTLGFSTLKPAPVSASTKSMTEPST